MEHKAKHFSFFSAVIWRIYKDNANTKFNINFADKGLTNLVVVVLLLNVHGQQLRSWQDSQLI